MTPAEWEIVKELVDRALELLPEERARFLDKHCPTPKIREEVESLIRSYEEAETLLDEPVVPNLHLVPLPENEWVGQRVGPYFLLAEIGRGGMGTVYRAIRADDEFQKQVAVKLVKPGMDSEAILQRFRHERQILASLDHPYIARLLDGGTTKDGVPYFVMEYIEGLNLLEYADANRLNTTERLRLFRKVCSAVEYAHRNLVVHRDLKPGNILVTSEGDPKLLDFGIAKLLVSDLLANGSDPTVSEIRAMTPDYASPEQIRGERITTASDIYQLGLILYELLTGHKPYRVKGMSPPEALRVICEDEPARPSTVINRVEVITQAGQDIKLTPEVVSRTREGDVNRLRRRLSGDLDNIVLMTLRKEPERRYLSVEQLGRDIDRHLAGRTVTARKDTVLYRTRKFVRRNRGIVLAGSLLGVTLAAGVASTAWQSWRAQRRFNEVRQLANAFLFEVDGAIAALPGSTPARERIVHLGLEYLDRLASEAGGDRGLQRELAAAYQKVGDILGGSFNANLGRSAEALASYKKALAIRQSLVAGDPASRELRDELASSLATVGDMQLAMGDIDDAIASLRQALAIREQLVSEDPSDPKALKELASTYSQLVRPLIGKADWPQIAELRRREVDIYDRLKSANPADESARLGWAAANSNLGWALSHLPGPGGLDRYEESIAIQEAHLSQNPTDAQTRFELARSYAQLSTILERRGHIDQALTYAQKSLTERQTLANSDPEDVRVRNFLSDSQRAVGRLLLAMGRIDEAISIISRSVAISERVAAIDADDVFAQIGLGISRAMLGRAHRARAESSRIAAGRRRQAYEDAISEFRTALGIIEPIERQGKLNRSFFSGFVVDTATLKKEIEACQSGLRVAAMK